MSLVPVCAPLARGGGGQAAAGVWFCVSVAGSTQPRQRLGVGWSPALLGAGEERELSQGAWSPSQDLPGAPTALLATASSRGWSCRGI